MDGKSSKEDENKKNPDQGANNKSAPAAGLETDQNSTDPPGIGARNRSRSGSGSGGRSGGGGSGPNTADSANNDEVVVSTSSLGLANVKNPQPLEIEMPDDIDEEWFCSYLKTRRDGIYDAKTSKDPVS